MDYSIRELECFVAVAEELSFTRAARRMNLSQPPLSRHIRSLEDRLGVALFVRSPRSVVLTPAGRALLADTQGALTQLQRAADRAKRATRGETARLNLGFVSAVLSPGLIQIFQRHRAARPDVQLTLHDCPPADQLREIAAGRLDGGFVGSFPTTSGAGLVFIPWSQEPLMAFLPRGHRLEGAAKIRLAELAGESFVMVAAESAPCFAQQIHQLCNRAGFRPKVVQEAIRGQAVAVMVAAGAGVAILPASMARIAGDAAVALPITDKGAAVTYVFAHRKGEKAPALADFVAGLRV
ncbi:MAG: LysR family transcriptional regulator [Verrucomicrobia bacterium]|nr:LysR family transcriptional regulator [Verrucomicrobiota bacterium]